MKFAIVLLALVSAAFAAPQARKVFHENFEDFVDLIEAEVGDELKNIMDSYLAFDEFRASLDYLQTNNFKDLVYEMEDLPEFQAVREFLDTHSVDISYFLDTLNDLLESGARPPMSRNTRQSISGSDFKSYIQDSIAVFPKEKLAALFDEKLAEDADFKAAIEGLESEEFRQIFDALWASSIFQAEVQALGDNGIDVEVLFDQLVAVFGQDI